MEKKIKIVAIAPGADYSYHQNLPIDMIGDVTRYCEYEGSGVLYSLDPKDLEDADAVVIPGGVPDVDPERYGEALNGADPVDKEGDALQFAMIEKAFALKKPILAFCRGLQLVNVYLGGSLIQDLTTSDIHHYEPGHPVFHNIYNVPGTPMFAPYGKVFVGNSGHHQAVRRLGKGLKVTSIWCADPAEAEAAVQSVVDGTFKEGTDTTVIECVYHESYPFLGLQWHPELKGEMSCTECDPDVAARIFHKMIRKCAEGEFSWDM